MATLVLQLAEDTQSWERGCCLLSSGYQDLDGNDLANVAGKKK